MRIMLKIGISNRFINSNRLVCSFNRYNRIIRSVCRKRYKE